MGGRSRMIVLITPTGARPQQLQLCAKWMAAQTYKGKVVWIIIDDAIPVSSDIIKPDFKKGWEIFKVYPAPPWQYGQNTQGRNIAAGILAMQSAFVMEDIEAIFIIEDDDYYKPEYLSTMVEKLAGYDIAGELYTVYYNVRLRAWLRNGNIYWSSLFQTAFTPAAIPTLERMYGKQFIDCHWFQAMERKNMFKGNDFSVGIKGQAGRGGIGMGHNDLASYVKDSDGSKLRELIGNDADTYLNLTW